MTGRPHCVRPGPRAAGFTLIELMIVVAVIAIIAAIAIPNLLAARQRANETAAVNMLRAMATAQAQFQRAGYADEDGDNLGEYGYLAELAGTVVVRGSTLSASSLSRSLGLVDANGEVGRSGYILRMYLPGAGGAGVAEKAGGGQDLGALDPDLSEVIWTCYAFPSRYGGSGARTFYYSQQLVMLQTEVATYGGGGCAALQAGAALQGSDATVLTGFPAVGAVGADGHEWRQIQ